MASRRSLLLLRSLYRTTGIRIIRGFQALALRKVYENMRDLDSGGSRFEGKLGKRYESGGAPTYSPEIRSFQLEGLRKVLVILPYDAGACRVWSIGGIPAENRKGGAEHMSPLRRGRRHGPAYAEVLSGVRGPPPYPATSDWREFGPTVSCESDAEGVTGVSRSPFIAKDRTEREMVRTSHPCRVQRQRAALRLPRWLQGSLRRGGSGISSDLHDGLNVQIPKEWLPQNGRRRRSASAAIRKRSRGAPVEHQADHRGVSARGVHEHFPTYKEKRYIHISRIVVESL